MADVIFWLCVLILGWGLWTGNLARLGGLAVCLLILWLLH